MRKNVNINELDINKPIVKGNMLYHRSDLVPVDVLPDRYFVILYCKTEFIWCYPYWSDVESL